MERTKHRVMWSVILMLVVLPAMASYRSDIYSAYITNNMDRWKAVIDKMESAGNRSNAFLIELINYQYGYIGYCIGFDKKSEARTYLSLAQKNLDILEKNNFNPGVVHAYKSAFYGFRIGLNPVSAPVNGLRSIDHAREAINLDPDNYLGYVQQGNIQFYMPSTFGGSKKEALVHYLRAREILEKDKATVSGNWNYMSLLIVIGQTYTYLKDYDKARETFDFILDMEPQFLYVSEDLYPKLLQKIENQ
ncbi:MAG: hypothetical protein RBT38_10265 [Bacteroidales bacterium]|nr:hypothetical protein [Bacteroidales bacterium]